MALKLTQHTPLPSPRETVGLSTTELRSNYLLEGLFTPGELSLAVTDLDRAIVGSACPLPNAPLELGGIESLRSKSFLERRELGVLNLGGTGKVVVEGTEYTVERLECLYAGRGAGDLAFHAVDGDNPPVFYLVSYPAHTSYPTRKVGHDEANILELGSKAEANERKLYQYIHEKGVSSCQLVMGYTELKEGSIWNTMPPHTHARRSEVYVYFDIPEGHTVLHMMGDPQETRPLWVQSLQPILSPAWSIHCGAGTSNYRFVWAMGGENQRFDDMDGFPLNTLR